MFYQLLKAPLSVYMISILHQAYMDFTILEYIAYNPRLAPLGIPNLASQQDVIYNLFKIHECNFLSQLNC